jgi:hypothetical protein
VKNLERWQEKYKKYDSELSLSNPFLGQGSALKDQILKEDMQERKTFIFGLERENESIVGPGIISIPLLSSKSGWALMATCYVYFMGRLNANYFYRCRGSWYSKSNR